MKDKTKLLMFAMGCVTLIIFGILFWPTLYRYDKYGGKFPVRINRITGYTEMLRGSTWQPVTQISSHTVGEEKKDKTFYFFLDDLQKEKIAGKAGITYRGNFNAEIYNGNNFSIKISTVDITLKNKDGTVRWRRSYRTNSNISALTVGTISERLVDTDGFASFDWCIEEVMGYK